MRSNKKIPLHHKKKEFGTKRVISSFKECALSTNNTKKNTSIDKNVNEKNR
jgi:hypothetical protein